MSDIAQYSTAPLAWEGPAVGLLDLDAFFASVEQLDHPDWRGKPVIVGGSADKRGVVSTASYEARRYGVRSAMPSGQAARLCPDAIWTQGSYARYSEMSGKVMAIIGDETPYVEQVSIDEAFFDVTPGRYSRESPIEICRRIQARVAELGITCSIGLSTSKSVAKIASEQEKPRGLTVVLPGTEASFMAPLPVRALSGIGPAAERALERIGIRTLGELARADTSLVESALGSHGTKMQLRARGQELSRVAAVDEHEEAKSVSNERTFERDLTDETEIRAAVLSIAGLVGRRLRKHGLAGVTVTLKVKHDAVHAHTAQRRLASATDDERIFGPAAADLLDHVWSPGQPVRLIGVGISGFGAEAGGQLALFTEDAPAAGGRDRSQLSATADSIRERFGTDALSYGRDLRFKGRTSNTQPKGRSLG